jgi:hypothetical protein
VTASASDSPVFDGSLAVDLRTLDTGIALRNEHLRENYLEVDKGPGFDTATLSKIDGKGSVRMRRKGRDPSPDC